MQVERTDALKTRKIPALKLKTKPRAAANFLGATSTSLFCNLKSFDTLNPAIRNKLCSPFVKARKAKSTANRKQMVNDCHQIAANANMITRSATARTTPSFTLTPDTGQLAAVFFISFFLAT